MLLAFALLMHRRTGHSLRQKAKRAAMSTDYMIDVLAEDAAS